MFGILYTIKIHARFSISGVYDYLAPVKTEYILGKNRFKIMPKMFIKNSEMIIVSAQFKKAKYDDFGKMKYSSFVTTAETFTCMAKTRKLEE